MVPEQEARYDHVLSVDLRWVTPTFFIGWALETIGNIADLRGIIPEPFDIFAHAGNLFVGVAVVCVVIPVISIMAMRRYNEREDMVFRGFTHHDMIWARTGGTIATMTITALINSTVETQWGVENLPIADIMNGTTPDPLDLIYSTAWSGILCALPWKRVE